MITRKAGAALAAGCPAIVKPSEDTPLSALALAKLAEDAGIPNGVFNVLTCSRNKAAEVGAALCRDSRVQKISFTGSTAVGKLLMQQGAASMKRISLELGGNAPVIVFADADLDKAVTHIMACKFRNAGQTCISANRIYVQEEVADKLGRLLTERTAALRLGNGLQTGIDIGPLINAAAVDKVTKHVADALGRNAKILTGGKVSATLGPLFFEPTVLANCNPDMLVSEAETFGPVAALFPFKTEAEALGRANDTSAGLASYVFTRDAGRALRVGESLKYGMVGINTGAISMAEAPFGGMKESGVGREGGYAGMDEFMELQTLHIQHD
jgi:succinate-semialdehyde dehydrogenase / glutarate-semialdehyde dehydrogenase